MRVGRVGRLGTFVKVFFLKMMMKKKMMMVMLMIKRNICLSPSQVDGDLLKMPKKRQEQNY